MEKTPRHREHQAVGTDLEDAYLKGKFVKQLPADIFQGISAHSTRNSHLISIAPTGTISLCADNISSGIEPVFAYSTSRTIQTNDGPMTLDIPDYGVRVFNVKGKYADDLRVQDHLNVLLAVSKYVDSAVSKTCNVGADVTWEEFKKKILTERFPNQCPNPNYTDREIWIKVGERQSPR